MKFNETGLPSDTDILNAFSMYEQNAAAEKQAGGAAPAGTVEDMPVQTAITLHKTGAETSVIALALISQLPPDAWGAVKRRFGEETAQNLNEAYRHQRTNFAYIEDAPQAVQQLVLASSVVSFTAFEKLADTAIAGLEAINNGYNPPDGLNLPMLPDARVFARIGEKTYNASGNDSLELLYGQTLDAYRTKNDTLLSMARDMGLPVPPPSGLPGAADGGLRYPAFEETGLQDDQKVRGVYDMLTEHGAVRPDMFEAALATAKILTETTPDKNPTTIAAALLDVALPALNTDDLDFLEKKIDWDVLALVKDNSVYSIKSTEQIAKAPVEFRQIVLAHAVAVLDDAQKGAVELFEIAQTQNLQPQLISQHLRPLLMAITVAERIIMPAAPAAQAPLLEALLADKIEEFKTYLKDNAPKQNQPRPRATFSRDAAPQPAPETAHPKKRIASFDDDDTIIPISPAPSTPKKTGASFEKDPPPNTPAEQKKDPSASAQKPKKGASFDF